MNATWKLIFSIVIQAIEALLAGLGVFACVFGMQSIF